MKGKIIFSSVLLLTSCHLNDTRPENHRAKVSVLGESVCITLTDSKNEALSQLSINEIGHVQNRVDKIFFRQKMPVLHANECLPSIGFNFEAGKSYVYSANTLRIGEGQSRKNGNSYSVTFSVWTDEGRLQVKDIN
ncbi:putative T6SS immunity periplasmic lipoprotein [Rosenbergiella epipactidis]|uniref:putative T6SS immunity periplasmic lipoprotein n=1 Tax=Rosenbergiella epipactidis TaxID=1544694 RepID=UPI001F4EAE50|nr:putative T6SS immunity periplasmic lipoprotein [Rosenbergiella epipactidis]